MAQSVVDLYPEPSSLQPAAGLKRMRETLDALMGMASPLTVIADDAHSSACTLLRHRLAVRGWVAPIALLADVPPSVHEEALRAVSQEVELSERTRPGQWFMTLAGRRRVFTSAPINRLREVSQQLFAGDNEDPVRLALSLALSLGTATSSADAHTLHERLKYQPVAVLREMARMAAWGSAIPGLEALAAAAGAQGQRQARDRELQSAGSVTLFGRERELQLIREFLQRPPRDFGQTSAMPALYISGIGGSGKSALLLASEKELRSAGQRLVVRLDFDNPYLNPLNLEQMDIVFLQALSVEEPMLAQGLGEAIGQLQSLIDARLRARIDTEGGVQSSNSTKTVRRQTRDVARARYAGKSGSDPESFGNSAGYERISILTTVSLMREFRQRGVVLFLDTLENVGRLGADGIDAVLQWLSSIPACVPDRSVQGVLAGRDAFGSPDMRALAQQLRSWGLELTIRVELGDLDESAAVAMLEKLDMPVLDARLAAAALPRNPLVLLLAAQAFATQDADLTAIQENYKAGRIDRATAAGYLAQRVIQHVPRQPARRYAVAAMALEQVTERTLREIVIPVVDSTQGITDRKLAKKVFQGLKRATWLAVESRPGVLRWHTELRRLALPMIEADTDHALVARQVRGAVAAARGTNATAGREDEELYRLKMEGFGNNLGEGDRLVAQGRGRRALKLYRERPTRAQGIPPTFVIRALALTGDWERGEEVDAQRVLQAVRQHFELRGNTLQPAMLERLYWLTRLEMLRGGPLPAAHAEFLRDACRSLKFGQRNGAFLGLVGVAEALQTTQAAPLSLIAPADWPPSGVDVGPELRFCAVRATRGRLSPADRARWVSTTLGAMLLLDERWPALLQRLSLEQVLSLPENYYLLHELPALLDRQRNESLAGVEKFVASCRDVKVRIDLARLAPADAAVLLRGSLVEFHAPLSALLSADALWDLYDDDSLLRKLLTFVEGLGMPSSAIVPLREFQSRQHRQSQARDPQAATSAVLVMLDRAGCLGTFCTSVMRDPDALFALVRAHHPIARNQARQEVLSLMRRYLEWDDALRPVAASAALTQGTR